MSTIIKRGPSIEAYSAWRFHRQAHERLAVACEQIVSDYDCPPELLDPVVEFLAAVRACLAESVDHGELSPQQVARRIELLEHHKRFGRHLQERLIAGEPLPPDLAARIGVFLPKVRRGEETLWRLMREQLLGDDGEGEHVAELEAPADQQRIEWSGQVVATGVSLQTAALLLCEQDKEAAQGAVDRWRKRKGLPDAIGADPDHKQRQLYEPARLCDFLEKTEGPEVVAELRLRQVLAARAIQVREPGNRP